MQWYWSAGSSSVKVNDEISVKHLIASVLEWIGKIKCWIKLSIRSVPKMKFKGIQLKNAYRVLRHDLMSEGAIWVVRAYMRTQ